MSRRQLLLRVMLWSLGASAVAGVCAVLVGEHDVIWRVAGTGASAAVAAGLLLVLSRLIDRDSTRPAGLLGMSGVILEFLLALSLIWELSARSSGYFDLERVALTVVAVALAAPAAMFFLYILRATRSTVAGWVGLAVCATSFGAMLAGSWLPGDTWRMPENWWATAGILAAFGLAAAAALGGMEAGGRHWRWLGVAAATVSGTMALVGLWAQIHSGGEIFACVSSVAVFIGYLNLALLVPLSAAQRWVRWVSVAALAAASALVDVLVVTHEQIQPELLGRLAGAAGVVAACSSLALLVLARINRRIPQPVSSDLRTLEVVCPHCRRRQTIPTGGAACGGCGLRVYVRLEEPRCPHCEYLLYGITSDRCPECGTPIRASGPRPVADAAPAREVPAATPLDASRST